MVTEIAKRQGGSGLSADEKEISELSKAFKTGLTETIKARSSSFKTLAHTAAIGMYLMVVHGRSEQFNELFVTLAKTPGCETDADALRQKFALRVDQKFAVDGIWNNESKSWDIRPTRMIDYKTRPAVTGAYFSRRSAKDDDQSMKDKVNAFIAKVREAGVEGLAAIQWDTFEGVTKRESAFTLDTFKSRVAKLLLDAAKEIRPVDADIPGEVEYVHKGMITHALKVFDITGDPRAKINAALREAKHMTVKPVSASDDGEGKVIEHKADEKPQDRVAA